MIYPPVTGIYKWRFEGILYKNIILVVAVAEQGVDPR